MKISVTITDAYVDSSGQELFKLRLRGFNLGNPARLHSTLIGLGLNGPHDPDGWISYDFAGLGELMSKVLDAAVDGHNTDVAQRHNREDVKRATKNMQVSQTFHKEDGLLIPGEKR